MTDVIEESGSSVCTSGALTPFDIRTVLTYFGFLNPSYDALHTVCVMDAKSEHPVSVRIDGQEWNGACLHLKGAEIVRLLEKVRGEYGQDGVGDSGVTLHACINSTNLKGRRTENIDCVQVFAVDIDTTTSRARIGKLIEKYAPHLVVMSSGVIDEREGRSEVIEGKFHFYWKCEATIDKELWSKYQLGLAHKLGGDYALKSISKMLRVPGVSRVCKDGSVFMPRIVYAIQDEITPLTVGGINSTWPWMDKAIADAEALIKSEKRRVRKALGRVGSESNGQFNGHVRTIDVSKLGRNESLYNELFIECVQGRVTSMDEAREFAERVNSLFSVRLDGWEVEKTVKSAFERGLARREENDAEVDALMVEDETEGGAESMSAEGESTEGETGDVSAEPSSAESVSAEPLPEIIPDTHLPYSLDGGAHPIMGQSLYSDMAVESRLLQVFDNELLRVIYERGDGEVFAFREEDLCWVPQSTKGFAVIGGMVEQILRCVVREREFVRRYGSARSGGIDLMVLQNSRSRYLSANKKSLLCKNILQSSRLRTAGLDVFDSVREVLHVGNGLLDMASGKVRKARGEDYLLRRTSVKWNPSAKSDKWENFLRSVFTCEAEGLVGEALDEIITFIQELFGYSLSGFISEQKIFCHVGEGSNGKSKVMSALRMIGGSYVGGLAPDEIVTSTGKLRTKGFERYGAAIEGRRVMLIDDIETRTVWNEGLVKMVTSDTIKARAEYEREREVVNRATLHMGLNRMPAPESENNGLLRRLCFIPYMNTFEARADVSAEIDALIKDEREGILRWAVEGFQRWYSRQQLTYPGATVVALEEYKQEFFTTEVGILELIARPKTNIKGAEGAEGAEDGAETSTPQWIPIKNVAEMVGTDPREVGALLRKLGFKVALKWIGEEGKPGKCVLANKTSAWKMEVGKGLGKEFLSNL